MQWLDIREQQSQVLECHSRQVGSSQNAKLGHVQRGLEKVLRWYRRTSKRHKPLDSKTHSFVFHE